MKYPIWILVLELILLATAPVAGQQPREENRPPMAFVPLLEPRFVPAAKADFLKDGDRVVGVSENGVSKAYQPKVLAFHHVVQDSLRDLPIIATWCALCNTPLVYNREVEGKKLTFQRAGNRGNNFYMVDAETGSHWQQIGGECFEGSLKGKRLTMVPFLYTTWGEWRTQHPDTLALVPEPAYEAGYEFMDKNRVSVVPYGSAKKPDRELLGQEDKRLPNYEQVIGIEVRNTHKAYPVSALRKQPVLSDTVAGEPVLLVYAAASDTTTAFSRSLGGRTLTFEPVEGGAIVDKETASKWSAYGECTSGKLKGQKLNRIVPQPGSWFAWAEFFPDTQVYTASAH
jgi:hypothetical protein